MWEESTCLRFREDTHASDAIRLIFYRELEIYMDTDFWMDKLK